MSEPAILILADSSIFHGTSIGVSGCTTGEVVFKYIYDRVSRDSN